MGLVFVFVRIATALLKNMTYDLKSLTKPYLTTSLMENLYKYNYKYFHQGFDKSSSYRAAIVGDAFNRHLGIIRFLSD
jgi:hypothetical protein